MTATIIGLSKHVDFDDTMIFAGELSSSDGNREVENLRGMDFTPTQFCIVY